jgi:hypothetical protein
MTNMASKAEELRARLKAEQEAKESKATKQPTQFEDLKFKGELIGAKTNYVLRILPHIHVDNGENEPWVRTYVHIFPTPQGVKRFALCPSTFDAKAPCPMCERSRELFKKVNAQEASKAEEDVARKFYRKPRYFVNVLVVDDPRATDKGNQKGKILIWELGQQIFEKFNEALVDQGKFFYLPNGGYNFNLTIKKKADFVNYESSHFASEASNLPDEVIAQLESKVHDLNKFALKNGARPYDDLIALMEGKEIVKKEREYDSATGKTDTRAMNAPLNETVELHDEPAAPKAAAAVAAPAAPAAKPKPKALTDDELLASIDDLTIDPK